MSNEESGYQPSEGEMREIQETMSLQQAAQSERREISTSKGVKIKNRDLEVMVGGDERTQEIDRLLFKVSKSERIAGTLESIRPESLMFNIPDIETGKTGPYSSRDFEKISIAIAEAEKVLQDKIEELRTLQSKIGEI